MQNISGCAAALLCSPKVGGGRDHAALGRNGCAANGAAEPEDGCHRATAGRKDGGPGTGRGLVLVVQKELATVAHVM